MIIDIDVESEKEDLLNVDYMGKCSCGCGIEMYKSMTVFKIPMMVYSECLEKYLNDRMVVL
jgi:hypothetical protein